MSDQIRQSDCFPLSLPPAFSIVARKRPRQIAGHVFQNIWRIRLVQNGGGLAIG